MYVCMYNKENEICMWSSNSSLGSCIQFDANAIKKIEILFFSPDTCVNSRWGSPALFDN